MAGATRLGNAVTDISNLTLRRGRGRDGQRPRTAGFRFVTVEKEATGMAMVHAAELAPNRCG